MKKFRNILVLALLVFAIVSMFSYTKAESSGLRLNNLDFYIQINEDGSMDITEIWDIKIENTNTLFKTFEIDKSKYSKITNGEVSKITSNGTELNFKNANQYYYHVPINEYYFLQRGNEYEVAWGTGYEEKSGNERYKISYQVKDAIAKYDDCSEMYWQLLGSNFEIPAKKITGIIKLPEKVANVEDIKVWGHTPDLNGTIYKKSNDTIEFNINDNRAKKMVEVRIAMPTDLIMSSGRTYVGVRKLESILKEETGWANKANKNRISKIVIVAIVFLCIFGILIYIFIRNILIIKNTKAIIPTKHYEYFRDLPKEDTTPAEALYILENKHFDFNVSEFSAIFSATLLDLSLKKAISLSQITNEKGKEDTKIEMICENITNITNKKDEILIYNFIKESCKNSNSITMDKLKKYIQKHSSKVEKLKSELDKYIKSKLLSENMLDYEGMKKKDKLCLSVYFSIFGTFFLFIFVTNMVEIVSSLNSIGIHWCVLVAIFIFVVINLIIEAKARKKVSTYTQQGVDEQDKWKAFKKYMEDFSLLKEKEIPDIILWEKFLVYATAFGISEKVIKQLKIAYTDIDNLDYSLYPHMYMYMHTDFNRSFNSVSTSMSSAFSSGSGSGGGFSGGGGRRWRPEVVAEEDNLCQ